MTKYWLAFDEWNFMIHTRTQPPICGHTGYRDTDVMLVDMSWRGLSLLLTLLSLDIREWNLLGTRAATNSATRDFRDFIILKRMMSWLFTANNKKRLILCCTSRVFAEYNLVRHGVRFHVCLALTRQSWSLGTWNPLGAGWIGASTRCNLWFSLHSTTLRLRSTYWVWGRWRHNNGFFRALEPRLIFY